MYHNQVVAVVKAGGKVLRESGNIVTIPFGSEYSVLIKNLKSVRIQFKVSVDGTDATNGTWIIIPANGSVELERFIRNGNWERGNRFKFIERTHEIEEHRGIKAEDGLIRIEYQTERISVPRVHYYDKWVPIERPYIPDPPCYPKWPRPYWDHTPQIICDSGPRGSSASNMGVMRSAGSVNHVSTQNMNCSLGNDSGITVAGSESNQKFVAGAWFPVESQSEVIVLQLRGEVAGKKVTKAVTVNLKSKCVTCGRSNKSTAQFCGKCGTAVQII